MEERLVAGETLVRLGPGISGRVADATPGMAAVLFQPTAAAPAAAVEAAFAGLGIPTATRSLPDGDDAKTLTVVEELLEWLAEVGLKRDGVIVGVGGGAATDAVGFTASVYMRGVEARYVPTTLLGALDAAIGGKTGVNVAGKNLAGTFAHPSQVVVDTEVLAGLDDELLAEGFAEALKAGLVGDAALFELIGRDGLGSDLMETIRRAITVKAEVVAEDFREAGRRMILNFGHTIGHAVERVTGWRHGPSIAVGMVAAAEISRDALGFDDAEAIRNSVERLRLPVRCPDLDRGEVLRLIAFDKKADAAGLRMVLLEAVGAPVVTHVDPASLDLGLASIGIS